MAAIATVADNRRMRAMSLDATGRALRAMELPIPPSGPDEVVLRVEACAVCRADLHVVDGELAEPKLPLVPWHSIVGTVVDRSAWEPIVTRSLRS